MTINRRSFSIRALVTAATLLTPTVLEDKDVETDVLYLADSAVAVLEYRVWAAGNAADAQAMMDRIEWGYLEREFHVTIEGSNIPDQETFATLGCDELIQFSLEREYLSRPGMMALARVDDSVVAVAYTAVSARYIDPVLFTEFQKDVYDDLSTTTPAGFERIR